MHFIGFWWHNFTEAFELGDGIIFKIEVGLGFIGGAIKVAVWIIRMKMGSHKAKTGKAHNRLHEWWEHAENKILAFTWGIGAVMLLFCTVFVVPYHRHHHEEERAETSETNAVALSKELNSTKLELKSSESARLAQLENRIQFPNQNSEVQRMLDDAEKKQFDVLSAKQPELARLSQLANSTPRPITVITNGPLDIQTIRAERIELENQEKELQKQRETKEKAA